MLFQVTLAVRYQKALLVHERDSHEAILDVLKEFESSLPHVIIHCFTGTPEQIRSYVERGYYIGITGYICKGKKTFYFGASAGLIIYDVDKTSMKVDLNNKSLDTQMGPMTSP